MVSSWQLSDSESLSPSLIVSNWNILPHCLQPQLSSFIHTNKDTQLYFLGWPFKFQQYTECDRVIQEKRGSDLKCLYTCWSLETKTLASLKMELISHSTYHLFSGQTLSKSVSRSKNVKTETTYWYACSSVYSAWMSAAYCDMHPRNEDGLTDRGLCGKGNLVRCLIVEPGCWGTSIHCITSILLPAWKLHN